MSEENQNDPTKIHAKPPKLNLRKKTSSVSLSKETVRIVIKPKAKGEKPVAQRNLEQTNRVRINKLQPVPKITSKISPKKTSPQTLKSKTSKVRNLTKTTAIKNPPSLNKTQTTKITGLEKTKKIVLPPPGSTKNPPKLNNINTLKPSLTLKPEAKVNHGAKTIPLKKLPASPSKPTRVNMSNETKPKAPAMAQNTVGLKGKSDVKPPQATINLTQKENKKTVEKISKTNKVEVNTKTDGKKQDADYNPHLTKMEVERGYIIPAIISFILTVGYLIIKFITFSKIN